MSAARSVPWRLLFVGGSAAAALAVSAIAAMPTRLVWNVTESVPTGLYVVQPVKGLKRGDLVAIMAPEPLASWLFRGGYLGRGAPLLKRVEGLPGARVCRQGERVTVDGQVHVVALRRDRLARPLPVWSGCRTIGSGEVFLLNAEHPQSLDGRYFGPLPRTAVIGRAVPIWTRGGRP